MNRPSRREFLKGTTAACGLYFGSARGALSSGASRLERIDAHTHFYDPRRPQGVPWPNKQDSVLYRPRLPDDLRKAAPQINGTVVVEASAWLEDNQWILDLAEKDPLIVGFVGRLMPGTEEFASHVERFARNRLFRGIRIQGQAIAQGLGQTEFLCDMHSLADHDLALDVNGVSTMLEFVALLAKKVPRLRIVINHVANVKIDGKAPSSDWKAGMQSAAAQPNVFCKVSALVEATQTPDKRVPADIDYYRPVLDVLWQTFGDERLIYASNWPVCERFAPYATVERIVDEYLQSASTETRRKFFAANAKLAYKWVDRTAALSQGTFKR